MSCGSKDIFKNAPCLMHYSHHDVTDLVNRRMVKNTKTWIAWERNVNFLQNKKIMSLCLSLRWHIMRSYRRRYPLKTLIITFKGLSLKLNQMKPNFMEGQSYTLRSILKFIFFWFYIFIYVFCLHSNGGERALRKGQRAGTILHSWEDVFIGEGGR